jgi:hypothetical protein
LVKESVAPTYLDGVDADLLQGLEVARDVLEAQTEQLHILPRRQGIAPIRLGRKENLKVSALA